MLDVELPAELAAEPDTPNRKKTGGAKSAADAIETEEGEAPQRLTVSQLQARHADSSDDSGDEAFDDPSPDDTATGA